MEENHTTRGPNNQQSKESQKTGDGVSRRRFMELMLMAGLAAMGTTGIDPNTGPKIRPVDTMAALLEAPTSQPVWVRAFYADWKGKVRSFFTPNQGMTFCKNRSYTFGEPHIFIFTCFLLKES